MALTHLSLVWLTLNLDCHMQYHTTHHIPQRAAVIHTGSEAEVESWASTDAELSLGPAYKPAFHQLNQAAPFSGSRGAALRPHPIIICCSGEWLTSLCVLDSGSAQRLIAVDNPCQQLIPPYVRELTLYQLHYQLCVHAIAAFNHSHLAGGEVSYILHQIPLGPFHPCTSVSPKGQVSGSSHERWDGTGMVLFGSLLHCSLHHLLSSKGHRENLLLGKKSWSFIIYSIWISWQVTQIPGTTPSIH